MANFLTNWGLTRKQIIMVCVFMFGSFVTILNQTIVAPALPTIMTEMSIDAAKAQWLTTGFTLVNAIMIPITAYLIDRFATRSLFLVSMTLFTFGSALAGWAPTFDVLLLGRLVQAAGAGVLMPMVMTVLMLTFPLEHRGVAMGLFGVVIAFAPAIGPTVAGIVIDTSSWHIMFYGISILSFVVILVAIFSIDKIPAARTAQKLDKLSVVLSTVGFGSLLYGFSVIGSYGFSLDCAIAIVLGSVVLVLFFKRQLSMEHPMLQVRVLENKTFLMGTIIGMVVQGTLLSVGILIPIYVQTLLGYSATVSGLVILPGALLMGVMGPIAGRLFDRHGPRTLAVVGMSLLTVGTCALMFLDPEVNIVYLSVILAIRMFALSLVNMPITTWAMNALSNKYINHGTSVNNTLRQVAGTLGTAILISVFSLVSGSLEPDFGYLNAQITGINVAFAVTAVLCLVALVLVIIFVKDNPQAQADADIENKKRGLLESIMKKDVFTIPETATVFEAMQLLVKKGISAAPLVNTKGEAIGFVSDGDIMRFLSSRTHIYTDPVIMIMNSARDTTKFDEKLARLMELNVRDVATKGIIGVSAHASLNDVCRVLGDNHLKKVPVLDDGKIVGIINRSDITLYSMRTYVESKNTLLAQKAAKGDVAYVYDEDADEDAGEK